MSEPIVNKSPGVLRFTWEMEQIVIQASRFHDTKNSCSCEMRVVSTSPVLAGRELIHIGTLNLMAPQSQASLAKVLSKRLSMSAVEDNLVAWENIVLQFVSYTVEHMRQGEPPVDLESDMEVQPLNYLINPIIPRGEPSIMFGREGSGKSFLALAMATIIQTGMDPNPLNLKLNTGPVNVLYIDYETSREMVARRFAMVSRGMGIESKVKIKYQRCYSPFAGQVDKFHSIIMREKIGFVVLDSLGAACGGELKEAEPALAISNALRELGVSSLTIAHPAKGGNSDGEKTIYGSVFFQAYARSIWEVRSFKNGGMNVIDLTISQTKANDSALAKPLGFGLEFSYNAVTIEPKDTEDIVGAEELLTASARVEAALRHGDKLKTQELVDETGLPAGTVRQCTLRMKNAGKLQKGEDGKWFLLYQAPKGSGDALSAFVQ